MQLACTQKMQLCLFAVRKGKKTAMRKTHNGHFNIIFDVIASETRPDMRKLHKLFMARAGFPVCPRYRKRRMQYTPLTSTCTKYVHHCPVPLLCAAFPPCELTGSNAGAKLFDTCVNIVKAVHPRSPARPLCEAGAGWSWLVAMRLWVRTPVL